VWGHDHDRRWSSPENAFGHGPEEQPLDARSTVRAHDNEIRREAAASRNDDIGDARPLLNLDVHRSIAYGSLNETTQVLDDGCGSRRLEHGSTAYGERPNISTVSDRERWIHVERRQR
jgi:hypothetical protein